MADGRLWIDVGVDFQLAGAPAVLSDDGPLYAFLTRARGASKTIDLARLALAMLLAAEHRARFVWTAADADQARLAHDAIEALPDRFRSRLSREAGVVITHGNGP